MVRRDFLHRCFVQYNPLYFASAFCILAGAFLVGHGLPADDFGSKAALAAVLGAYRLLVLGGAFLLLRAGQQRPAVLLGLVSLAFLLDPALLGERLFSHVGLMSLEPGMRARRVAPWSLGLALSGPVHVALLVRLFRLKGAWPIAAALGAAAGLLPLLPWLFEAAGPGEARRLAHLGACSLGAPLLALAGSPAFRRWSDGLDPRIGRIAAAVPYGALAVFGVHALSWSAFPDLQPGPAHLAPYLLAATLALVGRRRDHAEPAAWIGAAASIGAALLDLRGPAAPGATALLVSAACFLWAGRNGFRMLLPAVASAFLGAWTLVGFPGAGWLLVPGAILVVASAAQRDFRCLAGAALAIGIGLRGCGLEPAGGFAGAALLLGAGVWFLFPALRRWILPAGAGVALVLAAWTRRAWWPGTAWAAGVAFLAAGFALLGAGVAANLGLARRGAPGD